MVADPSRPDVLYMTTGFGRYADDPQPREERIAGAFRSKDGGESWEYLWKGIEPPYTRPMCVDDRAPYALTIGCAPTAFASHKDEGGAKSRLYQTTDARRHLERPGRQGSLALGGLHPVGRAGPGRPWPGPGRHGHRRGLAGERRTRSGRCW